MKDFDRDKLMAMVHYIADAVPSARLGKVKLNKILWFSDREMYLQAGDTISGEVYLKFPYGPVPKHILGVIEDLENAGKLAVTKARIDKYEQYEYISLVDPDLSCFTAQEIDIIFRQITWISPLTATDVSKISHV